MSFDIAKSSLLDKLTAGVDFSPKGSIDAPVIELVDFINDLPDYVTTSSCSGRISVFRDENSTKGIQWILVVHGVITVKQLKDAIITQDIVTAGSHYIVLKCEAFILHVRCRDLESGRKLHQIAMGCGFRESGLSMGQKRVQLAIRTTAYGLELPMAIGTKILLDDFALDVIVSEANRRLRKNFARTDRLLTALKKEYIWPSIMQMNTCTFSNINRWGHSCCSDTKGSCMVIGGYGVDVLDQSEQSLESQQSTRKLPNLMYTSKESTHFDIINGINDKDKDISMHAESITIEMGEQSYLLVSGGRISPQQALACLRVYKNNTTIDTMNTSNNKRIDTNNTNVNDDNWDVVTIDESGDIPSPRWGHTFTSLGKESNTFLLFGGRNEHQVFNDTYLLTATPISESNKLPRFQWHRTSPNDQKNSPIPRFFHAACLLPITDDHKNYLNNDIHYCVLIHGGILSIEDPITCGLAYTFNPFTEKWTLLHDINGTIRTISNPDSTHNPLLNDPSDVHADSYADKDTNVEYCINLSGHENGLFFLRRFGHVITNIGKFF
jgi:tRNA wybutosine-synthesizing protein 3